MRNLRGVMHSTRSLFTFEAAGRLGSFTRAADELHVSQPAISRSIRQLETRLGVALFHRGHRRVELTEAGEKLFHDVSIGLGHIARSVEQIDRRRSLKHIILSCSTAFANYWMVPRLADFRAANPDVDIRLETTDKDVDLAVEGHSLGIRRGHGQWAGYRAEPLAPELIYAVSSPTYPSLGELPLGAQSLLGRHLIHLEEPFRPRPTWAEWFASAGVRYVDSGGGLRLNDYALVLQAAMAGEGIALGWHHVTQRLIQQGMLCRVCEHEFASGSGFYIIWSERRELSGAAAAARDWIIEAARSSLRS